MFYTSQRIRSYKRFYNIIVGERGVGKTFDFTYDCIKSGIETKKKSFVWLRRYDADIDEMKNDFWIDMVENNLFPNYHFETIKGNIIATNVKNGEKFIIGELMALSLYQRKKSKPRPNVKTIIFDEFIAEDGTAYLDNEVRKFLNIVDTIARHRPDVKVYLLGNAVSMVNPYFDYFKIRSLDRNFTKGRDYVVENCDYQEFREFKRKSAFGKTVDGTKYGDYAIDNKFLLDDTSDVLPKPKGEETILFNLLLNGRLILLTSINNLYYFSISKDITMRCYTFYVDDAKKGDAIFIDGKSRIIKEIAEMFVSGLCVYQNLSVKNEIQLIVRKVKKGF